jgi:hypothetical protein
MLEAVRSRTANVFVVRDDVSFPDPEVLKATIEAHTMFDYWGLVVQEMPQRFEIPKWMRDEFLTDKTARAHFDASMSAYNGIFLSSHAIDLILSEKDSRSVFQPRGLYETRVGMFMNDNGIFPLVFELPHRVHKYRYDRKFHTTYEFDLDGNIAKETYEFLDESDD